MCLKVQGTSIKPKPLYKTSISGTPNGVLHCPFSTEACIYAHKLCKGGSRLPVYHHGHCSLVLDVGWMNPTWRAPKHTHTRGTLYQAVYYLTLNWYITPTYIPGISWPVESKTSGGHGYYHYVLPGCVSATRLTWCGTSSLCLSVDVLVSRRAVDVLVVSRSMREIGWCGCRLDVHRGAL